MNKVILMGRLTKDSDCNTSASGVVACRNTLAVDRGKDKDGNDRGADFISILTFGKRAEWLEKYGTKGRRFLVEGRIQSGSYTNKDGQKVYTTDVVVDRIEFGDSKSNSEQAAVSDEEDAFMHIPEGIEESVPFN